MIASFFIVLFFLIRRRCGDNLMLIFPDMSPLRWVRRKSSSSESERNCYNVQTSQVTTERGSGGSKKDKKRIQDERRKTREKRNPLLDRVRNARLSFFREQGDCRENDIDIDIGNENEEPIDAREDDAPLHGVLRLRAGRTRTPPVQDESRRFVCCSEVNLRKVVDRDEEEDEEVAERLRASRKRRSKSHNQLPIPRNDEETDLFSGGRLGGAGSVDDVFVADEVKSRRSRWYRRRESAGFDQAGIATTKFDSVTPSSCLAAKFRAMQDRYLKSSTSRLIAKFYKRDTKDDEDLTERRRLRSFSYGTLPGLDELRTNPIYVDHELEDDNDSGILDNDSATSSILDDRFERGGNDSAEPPPRLPPRRTSVPFVITDNSNGNRGPVACNVTLGIEKDPLANTALCQAKNSELISRRGVTASTPRGKPLPVVRNRSYTSETMVVRLTREVSDQSLGIFIAKTSEARPGYLVAHVVPNGLADKEGSLRIGDEILVVNGKRLRGCTMTEAKRLLAGGSGPIEPVDIVVTRLTRSPEDQSVAEDRNRVRKLRESSVDYENVVVENGQGVLAGAVSPRSHFRKHQTRGNESNGSISSEKSSQSSQSSHSPVSTFCTLPRRPRSTISTFHTVVFEKGSGKKSLGFTIVGGRDSPKGSIGELSFASLFDVYSTVIHVSKE